VRIETDRKGERYYKERKRVKEEKKRNTEGSYYPFLYPTCCACGTKRSECKVKKDHFWSFEGEEGAISEASRPTRVNSDNFLPLFTTTTATIILSCLFITFMMRSEIVSLLARDDQKVWN